MKSILRYLHLCRSIRSKQLQLASINGANNQCIALLQYHQTLKEEV